MTATHADALASLRTQVPERLFRFAELVATGLVQGDANPLETAARGVGAPGEGTKIMSDPRVSRVLNAILGQESEAFRDVRFSALRMLTAMVGYDPADATDEYGQIKRLRDIPPECRIAVESYKVKADGTMEIRFVKRLEAIRLLLSYFADIDNKALAVGGQAVVVFRGRGPLE